MRGAGWGARSLLFGVTLNFTLQLWFVTQISQQLPHLTTAEETANLQCRSRWCNILLHFVIYIDKKLECCSLDFSTELCATSFFF